MLEERKKNPSPSLDERIERARRRAHQVAIKIQQDQVRGRPCASTFLTEELTRGLVVAPQESSRSEPVPGYVIAGKVLSVRVIRANAPLLIRADR